jgi:hypothetical protein
MSSKMRYGPRFKPTIAGGPVGYDESIARATRRDMMKMHAIIKNMPLYKQELIRHKATETSKRRRAPVGHEREEAELRMAEAVRAVVGILEFHMADMMQHRQLSRRPKYVNQLTLHNVIVELKTRCGVSFDRGGEYDTKVSITPVGGRIGGGGGGMTVEEHAQWDAMQASERHFEREMMRQQRLRNAAELLKARPRTR